MAFRNLAKKSERFQGPTAPRKRYLAAQERHPQFNSYSLGISSAHPLTDLSTNERLQEYELQVKGRFDQIVPVLKKISALQHGSDFVERAQQLSSLELGLQPIDDN